MKRAIVTPAVLPPSALAELKQWLGITTAHDDALLGNLLYAGLEVCEAFTGLVPLAMGYEEIRPQANGWQKLATLPVQSIVSLEALDAAGNRTGLPATDYAIDLDESGCGRFRLLRPGNTRRVAVGFVAGLAPDWENLPEALRHGIVRLAAHQHREREADGAAPVPPASIAALWRPWRRISLL